MFHILMCSRRVWVACLAFCLPLILLAQIRGVVTDAQTHETLPSVNIYYEDNLKVATTSDLGGHYTITRRPGGKLVFSYVGYKPQTVNVTGQTARLSVRLMPNDNTIKEVVVEGKRTKKKYSRKNNPAVDLMRKAVLHKKMNNLAEKDYCRFNRYEKMIFSVNEFTDKVFEEDGFKSMTFLKNHVETCPETGKLILPLVVDETAVEQLYRRDPKSEKRLIHGQKTTGVNEIINMGDILNDVLKDCFTDVSIYDDDVRMLRYEFISPLSEAGLSFYHYYIADTTVVGRDRCFHVSFVPANQKDFGFSGELYIMADSTWQVRRSFLSIPQNSSINFIENMQIRQEFVQLPTGERVQTTDDMLIQLKLTDFLTKFQVQRIIRNDDYSFAPIPKHLFRNSGVTKVDSDAEMRGEDFWKTYRRDSLSMAEASMSGLVKEVKDMKGYGPLIFITRAVLENFVSVGPEGRNPIEIGPINTIISHNDVDGLRLRGSFQTTAHLSRHFFFKGYGAYGFKDHRWKGNANLIYSFRKVNYLPHEFPYNQVVLSYYNDVMSPVDRFMTTDKDNIFTSFKVKKVDQMMYVKRYALKYDYEWENGLRLMTHVQREEDEPCDKLFYQRLGAAGTLDATVAPVGVPSQNPACYEKKLTSTEFMVGLRFQPKASYINTKQRRRVMNQNSPIFQLTHTYGPRGLLGSDYTYNLTEATIYKRFWLRAWGRLDTQLAGGVQWNTVPFPLLIMPKANLSYISSGGSHMFCLMDNMEFLNDRYASASVEWDLNGHLFNRIPLLNRLKWREYLRVAALWGTLTDGNNPFVSTTDSRLFYFPGHFDETGQWTYSSHVMDPKTPYVEVVAGIRNVLKFFRFEYVRRLTYIHGSDFSNTNRWGLRMGFDFTF